jgi:predicted ATPase
LALTDFHIKNYRSVRDAWLKLPRVTVIVGANGSGKSNLYRAMYLVSSTASGELARSIAEEGGMDSIMWSGKHGTHEEYKVNLSIKIDNLQYDLALGMLGSAYETFEKDLQIKRERVFVFKKGVKSRILSRTLGTIQARDTSGQMGDYTSRVGINESVLTGLREPHRYPELSKLRQELLAWRFYHHFRTDKDSPLRRPQLPVATSIMAHDGNDLASALATIQQWGNWQKFERSLDEAFPGATVGIRTTSAGLRLNMRYPGLERPLDASELSDGTLQYLCLLCSLYSLAAPPLLVLNEPETSIHPDLFEPLARLLVSASEESQIWITTHSSELSDYILDLTGYSPLVLEKVEGETRLVGVKVGDHPDDQEDDDEDNDDDEDEDDSQHAPSSLYKKSVSNPPGSQTKRKSKSKTSDTLNAKQTQIEWSVEQDPEAIAAAKKLEELRKRLNKGGN